MKFKVGDKIKGKKNNGYGIANENMIEAMVVNQIRKCYINRSKET